MIDITRRGAGLGLAGAALAGIFGAPRSAAAFPVEFTDAEWRRRLTRTQYVMLRQQGTERAYSSPLNNEKRAGTFACAGCNQPAFSSTTKYDSRTGWPSFWDAIPGGTGSSDDRSLGMSRTEIHCARCGGHLGHVFNDGPQPTGKRYCMNGAAMRFFPGAA